MIKVTCNIHSSWHPKDHSRTIKQSSCTTILTLKMKIENEGTGTSQINDITDLRRFCGAKPVTWAL